MRTFQISMAILGVFLFYAAISRADQASDDRILDDLEVTNGAVSQQAARPATEPTKKKPEVYKAIEPVTDDSAAAPAPKEE